MRSMIWLVLIMLVLASPSSVQASSCAIDVYDLHVENTNIVFQIKNTGTQSTTADYTVTVNGNLATQGSVVLDSTETKTITNSYSFTPGTFTITVDAAATCHASDAETIQHTILEQYSCTSPFQVNGGDYCDYATQSLLTCNSGTWVNTAHNDQQYCSSCQLTCGDNVCNCGETIGTCRQDCAKTQGFLPEFQCIAGKEQQKYQFTDGDTEWRVTRTCELGCDGDQCADVCLEGYKNEFICNGNIQEQRFVNRDCTDRFVPVQVCNGVCSDGICLSADQSACGVQIAGLEYTPSLKRFERGAVTFTIENTGRAGVMTMELFLDGVRKETQSVNMQRDGEVTRTMYYVPAEGEHLVEVRATTFCGAEDSQAFPVVVEGQAKPPIVYQPPQAPAPAPGSTQVTILPPVLDIPLYQGKTIAVQIISGTPQEFSVQVSGIPDDMLSYTKRISVSGADTQYIYVTPSTQGTFYGNVQVVALKEGKTFTQSVQVYVLPQDAVPTTGQVTAQTPMDMGWLGPLALIGLLAAALGAIVYYKRDDLQWARLFSKYPLGPAMKTTLSSRFQGWFTAVRKRFVIRAPGSTLHGPTDMDKIGHIVWASRVKA